MISDQKLVNVIDNTITALNIVKYGDDDSSESICIVLKVIGEQLVKASMTE